MSNRFVAAWISTSSPERTTSSFLADRTLEVTDVASEVVEVALGGDVGPADRWKVFHQGGGLIVPEDGSESLVEVEPRLVGDGHRPLLQVMTSDGAPLRPSRRGETRPQLPCPL